MIYVSISDITMLITCIHDDSGLIVYHSIFNNSSDSV